MIPAMIPATIRTMIPPYGLRAVLRRLAVLSLLAGPCLPACAAEPVFPPAGAVGLVPPPGMTSAERFAGFQHRSGASIVIVEMPVEAYGPLVAKFTPEALSATGFRAKGASEALPVAGGECRVLRGSQTANGLAYAKWVAVVRGDAGTGLVTVQVPESARRQVPDQAVEAALTTIAFRSPGSLDDQIAALPFRVGDLAGFRPVRTLMGNALLLTDGPKDVDPEGVQAVIIVAPALDRVAVASGQEGAFARKALGTIQDVRDIVVTDEDRVTRDGAVVVRLRGTGRDARSGRDVGVSQTIRFADAGYLRIIGRAGADRPELLARAERLAASVAPRAR